MAGCAPWPRMSILCGFFVPTKTVVESHLATRYDSGGTNTSSYTPAPSARQAEDIKGTIHNVVAAALSFCKQSSLLVIDWHASTAVALTVDRVTWLVPLKILFGKAGASLSDPPPNTPARLTNEHLL